MKPPSTPPNIAGNTLATPEQIASTLGVEINELNALNLDTSQAMYMLFNAECTSLLHAITKTENPDLFLCTLQLGRIQMLKDFIIAGKPFSHIANIYFEQYPALCERYGQPVIKPANCNDNFTFNYEAVNLNKID